MSTFIPTEIADLTAEQVTALGHEAGAAGDYATRDLCERCVSVGGRVRGSDDDLEQICEIINAARAARESE